ncbi:hypothetical protein POM88_055086 [Heracleum sosnowskyi]|uniref:NAC domain-containing protein n=1 Tax=Heracleum sosnowskyi TaxID=360622 RepID=A0AAD8GLR9_9APIA|nr:hypothetical protein POM88_055086 [Heracleum sosnowskyi]
MKKGIHPQMQWISYVTQTGRLIPVMKTKIHQVGKVYHIRARRQMAESGSDCQGNISQFILSQSETTPQFLISRIQIRAIYHNFCNTQERKLYDSCANPWQVFDPESHPWILSEVSCGKFEKVAYAFVNLTKKAAPKSNNKSKVGKEQYIRTAGCGTWDGKTKRTEIRDYDGNLIGERRMLVFEIKEVSHQEDLSRVGHWRMHEYSLCGINEEIPNLFNTVLCKITLEHSKEPAIELHSDGTTVKVDVKMDAVEQCYETDSVQTCDNDDVEQIYSIYDGCTCADDELVWFNSLFVRGEDGNYETDSVQTCDKDDVEEIHSIDDGCTCADDDLDCFKLKHRMCYGPCQTPTLGFCVQRYLQINTFKPEKFWAVHPYIIHNGYELKLEWERNRLFDTDVAEMFGGLIVEDAPYPLTANLSEPKLTF